MKWEGMEEDFGEEKYVKRMDHWVIIAWCDALVI